MSRRSTTAILLALVLILACTPALFAKKPPAHPGQSRLVYASLQRILAPPSAKELKLIAATMSLTPAQTKQIKGLSKAFAAAVKQVRPDRAASVKLAIAAVQQPAPSKSDFAAATSKVQQDDIAILSAEFDFWAGLKAILNPQQQQAASALVTNRLQREIAPPIVRTTPVAPVPPH